MKLLLVLISCALLGAQAKADIGWTLVQCVRAWGVGKLTSSMVVPGMQVDWQAYTFQTDTEIIKVVLDHGYVKTEVITNK